jgi:hypothetical protein
MTFIENGLQILIVLQAGLQIPPTSPANQPCPLGRV